MSKQKQSTDSSTKLVKAKQLLEEFRVDIESEIELNLTNCTGPLYDMIKYQLGSIDSDQSTRRRPHHYLGSLCLFSALSLGGSRQLTLPAAVAVELATEFNTIHHDIQQGEPKAGTRDTVWWLWGPAQAINAGDGMHILSRLALNKLPIVRLGYPRKLAALRTLDESILAHCEGQFLYLSYQERIDISVKQYVSMAEKKEGSFLSAALKLGLITSNSSESISDEFAQIGSRLGVVKQIISDLSILRTAFTQSKNNLLTPEIANKTKLLPVVYAIQNGTVGQKRQLGSIYYKKFLEPEDINTVQQVLLDTKAIEYSCQLKENLLESSLEELSKIEYNSDIAYMFPQILEIILSEV